MGLNSLKIGYFNENSLLIPCLSGNSVQRRVRCRLVPPPTSPPSFGHASETARKGPSGGVFGASRLAETPDFWAIPRVVASNL